MGAVLLVSRSQLLRIDSSLLSESTVVEMYDLFIVSFG